MALVSDLIVNIARDLHEDPTSFPPGQNELWTLDEIIGYISYAEKDFIRRTGVSKAVVHESVAAGHGKIFTKPTNMMDIDRVSFNTMRLRRVTSWDLARENPNWRNADSKNPDSYHEDHLPLNSFEVNNIPSVGGDILVIGDQLPTPHTTDLNEPIAVDDCWEQYIRWEVLSLALSKDGDAQDMNRASYAHQRYLLGCNLARRMTLGEALVFGAVTGNA